MKPLFQNFGLGWDINPEKLDNLKNDLEEVGKIDLKFYKSKFSLSARSFFTVVAHSEPSEANESNHVDILLNGALMAQFFRRILGFSGTLVDENISNHLYEKVEDVLSAHGYYTSEKFTRARWLFRIALINVGLAFLVSALYVYKILILSVPINRFPPELVETMSPETVEFFSQRQISRFEVFLVICWFVIGILWILSYIRYKKIFSL